MSWRTDYPSLSNAVDALDIVESRRLLASLCKSDPHGGLREARFQVDRMQRDLIVSRSKIATVASARVRANHQQ